jgi:hypothetical protein
VQSGFFIGSFNVIAKAVVRHTCKSKEDYTTGIMFMILVKNLVNISPDLMHLRFLTSPVDHRYLFVTTPTPRLILRFEIEIDL